MSVWTVSRFTLDKTTPISVDETKDVEMAGIAAYVSRETKGEKSSLDLRADG